ncbi:MAG: paraquat-inducible protein A [Pseudomonadota bacterium]
MDIPIPQREISKASNLDLGAEGAANVAPARQSAALTAATASDFQTLNDQFIACIACDALWRKPELAPGERVRCPRCHHVLMTNKSTSAQRAVALLATSLVLFALAVFYPFLSLSASGLSNEISVADATLVLWRTGYELLSIVCVLLILLFPLVQIVLTFFVALSLMSSAPISPAIRQIYGFVHRITPWAMMDIFMLGVVVSLVKIGTLADIHVGVAFWSLGALIVTVSMGANGVCADSIWSRARAGK